MIGNFILWLFKFIKQQTCIHEYKYIYRKDNGNTFQECIKCELIRD
jgi:hypothetical protein